MKSGNLHKAVFLDFDGVLFDTVKEAYCVAMLASGIARSTDEIDFTSEHYRKFRRHRFLITRAADYYYLLKAMDGMGNAEAEYNASIGSEPKNENKFVRKYFAKRNYLKTDNISYWLSLNTPYDFLRYIKTIIKRNPGIFFIITTKDKKTVIELLKTEQVKFYNRNIFELNAKNRPGTKGDVIRAIYDRYSMKEGLYVDDSKYHLAQASGIPGLRAIHAGWGYTSGKEKTVSRGDACKKIKFFLGD
jgi:phosphoglycolate phosphatase-like HAD superfamily hydrolase